MKKHNVSLTLLAMLLASAAPLQAQTAPAGGAAGAGAAKTAAVGAVSGGAIFATVAGLAVISALSSGSSGPVVDTAAATQSGTAASSAALTAVTQAASANDAMDDAVSLLQAAAGDLATTNTSVKSALDAVNKATAAADAAAQEAAVAVQNLQTASSLPIVGPVCAAITSCTRAEFTNLTFLAASATQRAVEAEIARFNAILALRNELALRNVVIPASLTTSLSTIATVIDTAKIQANTAVAEYNKVVQNLATSGPTLEPSTATTGTTGTTGTT